MKRKKAYAAILLAGLMMTNTCMSAMAATTSNEISQREKDNAELAKRVAEEGMVLLENHEQALPIKEQTIALFGNGAIRTVRGGTGSGDPFNGGLSGGGDALVDLSERYHINIYDAFVAAGYNVTTADFLTEFAKGYDEEKVAAGANPMATFAYPEMEVTEDLVNQAKEGTDTAIYVISRNAGEGADRSQTTKTGQSIAGEEFEVGDYELTELEKKNLELVAKSFDRVVVVLNVGGVIDTKFMSEIEGLDALLYMSQAGQEAGTALVDVVTGKTTPSGKLTSTWAKQYADYPASDTFASNDGDVDTEYYTEGIYVGYRYFDTFGIEPAYEFGYGLSYTEFDTQILSVEADEEQVSVKVSVTNTGDTYAGKEVVQVYFSAPDSEKAEKEYQELAAYAKTDLLQPGQSQELTICYSTKDMAYYDEAEAAYMLDAGNYVVRVGNSSRNTHVAAVLSLDETVKTEQLSNQLTVPEELQFEELSKKEATPYTYEGEADEIAAAQTIALSKEVFGEPENHASAYDDESVTTYTTDPSYEAKQPYEKVEVVDAKEGATLLDVYNGEVSLEEFVAQMSVEELATLNCGSGWGVANENSPIVGSNSDTIPGAAGETTVNYFDSYGIPSIVVADGPGGVRVKQEYVATDVNTGEEETYYQYCTAWPVSVLRGQTWNTELLEELGEGFARELKEMGITIVLGPSLNIHRDPLCGRNFEYYSEDPLIAGTMSAAVTNGVQETPGVGACLKHYAGNNQETNRNATNSVISERALREIYVKGFEIAVKASHPMSIMTSYNLINGIPAGDNYDLCTDLPRGEWGFDGLIMTDWNGGMSTPALSMHAGNDMIMPGGTERAENIQGGVQDLKPGFDERGQVALKTTIMYGSFEVSSAQWGEFVLDANGTEEEVAQLGEGYTASVNENGEIVVNDEPVYTVYESNFWQGTGEFKNPLTTEVASVSEDGKQIIYHGNYAEDPICIGDIQKSVMNNLRVIMNSIAMEAFYGEDQVKITSWSEGAELVSPVAVERSEVK
ncbi:MAG: glycoside hydrolase family 3 C-terminal domain-containing protein [Lachnospiraceae bacterium]|nr:glycoside hydrolase family 3 C-terminal domain-containing protein [Robinsoniella sp.]MDY3765763.1 glycoside hydrolase family 3 C-terminal domain-containing protein [Lachnospiraceae bacterium]